MTENHVAFLTPEQVQFYEQNGYLVLENFVSPKDVEEMKLAANGFMDEFEKNPDIPFNLFTTDEHQASQRNAYFQNSVRGVWPFFEAKAVDQVTGKLNCPYKQSINKIGHELHRTETAFKRITHTDACRRICEDLKVTNPIVPQSMYILKEARVGAEVSPHQDSTFLFTTPKLSCTAFWIPLENATTENGCLWVIPKSQTEPIRTRFKMADDGSGGAQYDPVIGDTWKIWPKDLFTAVPVSAGSLVLLHGSIIHMSLENLSDKPRHVYTWHVVSGDQKFEPDNWMGPGPFHPV